MAVNDVTLPMGDRAKFILLPTDFTPESELAFAHALRLAVENKAKLILMHVGDGADRDWDQFPSVRDTLERWGLLDEGSKRADVTKLGVKIEKITVRSTDIVEAIAGYAVEHPIDMLVVATDQRIRLATMVKPSIAEKTARKMAVPTLFVPVHGRGCIALDDGHVTMDQVLIPVDHAPPVGGAIERGLRAITAFGNAESQLNLLYVGAESEFPDVRLPKGPWKVERKVLRGNPVTEILSAANECTANLIIMVTKGSDGIMDALRGTTTENVIRNAPCPVLSIPADF